MGGIKNRHILVYLLLVAFVGVSGVYASPCDCLVDNNGVETRTCTVENAVCIVNTNITVNSGGNLTLINTTVRMNGSFDGEFSILVEKDSFAAAEMHIVNGSNITNGDNATASFLFAASEGTSFRMTDSHLSRVGWSDRSGLILRTTPIAISNNNFTENYIGLVLLANNAIIEHNTFRAGAADGYMIGLGNVTGIDIQNNLGNMGPGRSGIILQGEVNNTLIQHNQINASRTVIDGFQPDSSGTNLTIRNNSFRTILTGNKGIRLTWTFTDVHVADNLVLTA